MEFEGAFDPRLSLFLPYGPEIEVGLIYLYKEKHTQLTVSDSIVALMDMKAMCGTGRKTGKIHRHASWATKLLKKNKRQKCIIHSRTPLSQPPKRREI